MGAADAVFAVLLLAFAVLGLSILALFLTTLVHGKAFITDGGPPGTRNPRARRGEPMQHAGVDL